MFYYFKMIIDCLVYQIVLANFNGFIIKYIRYNLENCLVVWRIYAFYT